MTHAHATNTEQTQDEGTLVNFKEGTPIVTENDVSRKMFIIRKGKVRVYKTYMKHKVTIAILGEGEVFGELSFFDAQPRCATVEALTDVTCLEIDADNASAQIARLPAWVFSIMRQVFHRFREMDNKITILQSVNEYRKKAFKQDNTAKNIYIELLRFIKALELLYENSDTKTGANQNSLQQQLDDILGSNRMISLKVFWRQMQDQHVINTDENRNIILDKNAANDLKLYLENEIAGDHYLILKHAAIIVLRRLIGFCSDVKPDSTGFITIPKSHQALQNFPMVQEGLEELIKENTITKEDDAFKFRPETISRAYRYQSFLKAFDHTVVNLD
jgi:CRP-like cAMP-binding protein